MTNPVQLRHKLFQKKNSNFFSLFSKLAKPRLHFFSVMIHARAQNVSDRVVALDQRSPALKNCIINRSDDEEKNYRTIKLPLFKKKKN